MLLTHEQAGQRWCPQARSDHGRNRNVNTEERSFPASCRCIVASCALWVEIEPGKGVMACNPVMAQWALEALDDQRLVRAGVLIPVSDLAGQPASNAPDADGWIEWHGGECPVAPEISVQIRLIGGDENDGHAGGFDWGTLCGPNNIIAYRVVEG